MIQHTVLHLCYGVDKTYLHVRFFANLNRFARMLVCARAIACVSRQGLVLKVSLVRQSVAFNSQKCFQRYCPWNTGCVYCFVYQIDPQKHHPLFLANLPLNLQTVQAPPFGQSPPPLYWFSVNHPAKNWIFRIFTQKY